MSRRKRLRKALYGEPKPSNKYLNSVANIESLKGLAAGFNSSILTASQTAESMLSFRNSADRLRPALFGMDFGVDPAMPDDEVRFMPRGTVSGRYSQVRFLDMEVTDNNPDVAATLDDNETVSSDIILWRDVVDRAAGFIDALSDGPYEPDTGDELNYAELERRMLAMWADQNRVDSLGRMPYDEFDEVQDTCLLEMAEQSLYDQLDRENLDMSSDIPPADLLAMALAERLLQRGPTDEHVEVVRDLAERKLRIIMDIPISGLEDGVPGVMPNLIRNPAIHDQNAKTILKALLRFFKNNPQVVSILGMHNEDFEGVLRAAQSLLSQNVSEQPVDLPQEVQSIAADTRKAGRRSLKVRKKSD